jgi:hypothetical protein
MKDLGEVSFTRNENEEMTMTFKLKTKIVPTKLRLNKSGNIDWKGIEAKH